MKRIILTSILFLLSQNSIAKSGKSNISLQPIVGYERVQSLQPTAHTKDRFVYGLRLLFGPPLLSLEAQITQGNDTESFSDRDLSIKEEVTNAMLGIRSSFGKGPLRFYLRAGGHARKSKITTTQADITTTKEPGIYLSPYAGTGASLRLANILSLNAGMTAMLSGKPKGSDREYQTTLGFSFKI